MNESTIFRQKPSDILLSFALLIFSLSANAHGGISALDGLLEALIILFLLGIVAVVWLGYVIYMSCSKNTSKKTFSQLRKIIYVLTAILALVAVFSGYKEGINSEFTMVAGLIVLVTVSLTEASIFITKKVRHIG